MSFDTTLTITGLCLLIVDHPKTPKSAELLVLDTSNMKGDHRHHPYMTFLYDSRGNLTETQKPSLPGWEENIIGPDGRAITRVLLENTLVHIRAETESGAVADFVRDGSMAKVPDLRLLGVKALTQPGEGGRIKNVTSRIVLPAGILSATGDIVDDLGPVEWKGVGVVAEFVHLQLRALSGLTVDHGGNSFSLKPVDGRVELSISNEPTTAPPPLIDPQRNLVIAPHFGMFGLVADHSPELVHEIHEETPGNPACPGGSWVQGDWSFLS